MKRLLHKLLGDRGERAAARFLRRQGYRLLARSYRCQYGEIDLIAKDGRQIVFVEVKTRSGTQCGQPFEAVDRIKQQKLTRLALYWLKAHGRLNERARFDVVSVIWLPDSRQPQIDHFQHAFEASS